MEWRLPCIGWVTPEGVCFGEGRCEDTVVARDRDIKDHSDNADVGGWRGDDWRAKDGVCQRFQQFGALGHPIRQRRSVNVEPVAVEYLALPIQPQIVGILVDPLPGRRCLHRGEGHMGQQAGPASRGRGAYARSGDLAA